MRDNKIAELIAKAEAFDWGQDAEPYEMAHALIAALDSLTAQLEDEQRNEEWASAGFPIEEESHIYVAMNREHAESNANISRGWGGILTTVYHRYVTKWLPVD